MGFFNFSVTFKLAAPLQAWPLYASPKGLRVKHLEYTSDRVRLPPCWGVVAALLFPGVAACAVSSLLRIESAWYSNCGSRVDFSIQQSMKSVCGNRLECPHLPKYFSSLTCVLVRINRDNAPFHMANLMCDCCTSVTPCQLCECHRDVMGRLKMLRLSDGVGGSNTAETV